MANVNDNDLEELDFGEEPTPSGVGMEPEKKPSNRNFLVALGIIGGIFVLLTIALVVVALVVLPARNAAMQKEQANQLAANTATAQLATDAAMKAIILLTPSVTPIPSATALPTNTPVVAPQSTATPTVTQTGQPDSVKATHSAQQTELASGKFTTTVIATSTALPSTGFADQAGLPGLIGLGLVLVLIIVLARRMRQPSQS